MRPDEKKEKFTIDDIRFGDIVVLRDTSELVFASGYMHAEYGSNWCDGYTLDSWEKLTLQRTNNPKYDIMQVIRNGKTIWKRKVTEMTLAEVCTQLGYDIKIVEEEE